MTLLMKAPEIRYQRVWKEPEQELTKPDKGQTEDKQRYKTKYIKIKVSVFMRNYPGYKFQSIPDSEIEFSQAMSTFRI
jgi:hypothetical protein